MYSIGQVRIVGDMREHRGHRGQNELAKMAACTMILYDMIRAGLSTRLTRLQPIGSPNC